MSETTHSAGTIPVAEFVPDPNSTYLGVIAELPREEFDNLPPHPAQRQTAVHAAMLHSYGVLDPCLDAHREVAILLVGEPATGRTIAAMAAAFQTNPNEAIRRFGVKLNGHTRSYIWGQNWYPAPQTVRAMVYAAAHPESAVAVYRAVDSLQSAKGNKDMMQSTLNVAHIRPMSQLLIKAADLQPALTLAARLLYGWTTKKPVQLMSEAAQHREVMTHAAEFYRLLPMFAAVETFKPAIIVLDEQVCSPFDLPLSPPAFVAGYLSILHRDPEKAAEFIEQLKAGAGDYVGGQMDPFYAIKKIRSHLDDLEKRRTRRAMLTPAQRTEMILACILNSFQGWLSDENFNADDFPTGSKVLSTFNPLLESKTVRKAKLAKVTSEGRKPRKPPAGTEASLDL